MRALSSRSDGSSALDAAAARHEGISHIGDVRWAVLETSGKISFIEK